MSSRRIRELESQLAWYQVQDTDFASSIGASDKWAARDQGPVTLTLEFTQEQIQQAMEWHCWLATFAPGEQTLPCFEPLRAELTRRRNRTVKRS